MNKQKLFLQLLPLLLLLFLNFGFAEVISTSDKVFITAGTPTYFDFSIKNKTFNENNPLQYYEGNIYSFEPINYIFSRDVEFQLLSNGQHWDSTSNMNLNQLELDDYLFIDKFCKMKLISSQEKIIGISGGSFNLDDFSAVIPLDAVSTNTDFHIIKYQVNCSISNSTYSCLNGIQDNGETSVDIGGSCNDLKIVELLFNLNNFKLVIGQSASPSDNIAAIDISGKFNLGKPIYDTNMTSLNENMIVVGGPCINSVAARITGTNNATCASGFEPNKGKIQVFENNGKIQILVAGYEAMDTRVAAKALVNYASYGTVFDTNLIVTSGDLTNPVVE